MLTYLYHYRCKLYVVIKSIFSYFNQTLTNANVPCKKNDLRRIGVEFDQVTRYFRIRSLSRRNIMNVFPRLRSETGTPLSP